MNRGRLRLTFVYLILAQLHPLSTDKSADGLDAEH